MCWPLMILIMETPRGLGRTLIAAGLALGVGCAESVKPVSADQGNKTTTKKQLTAEELCANARANFEKKVDPMFSDEPCTVYHRMAAEARRALERMFSECKPGTINTTDAFKRLEDLECDFESNCPCVALYGNDCPEPGPVGDGE